VSENSRKMLNIMLALLISIAAWTYVVYNHEPMTDVKYRDIPIRFTGEDELAAKGFGVVESSRDTVNVVLTQRRTSTGSISAADITVTADVSAAVEGDNGVSLSITSPEGTQVTESDARSVSVKVEEADTKTVNVSVEYEGGEDQSTEPIVSGMSASTITVVGASSEVSAVDRAVASIRSNELTGNERSFSRTLNAVDKDGNVISHMIMYPGEISFNAKVGVKKTVKLNTNVMGETANDYERQITAPPTIVIKGDEQTLAGITSVDAKTINLSTVFEDTDFTLDYDLPDGVYVADESVGLKMHVTAVKSETDSDGEENDQ